jgi:hypothetical protein
MMLRCLELREPVTRFIRKLPRATDFDNDDKAEPLDYSPLR